MVRQRAASRQQIRRNGSAWAESVVQTNACGVRACKPSARMTRAIRLFAKVALTITSKRSSACARADGPCATRAFAA